MGKVTPELQSALNQALAVLVPALVAWVVAKIKGDTIAKGLSQVTKDTDAAFLKIRAAEEQLGIQTTVQGGKISVTTRAAGAKEGVSLDPQLISQKGR
jgi:hypothetical protein